MRLGEAQTFSSDGASATTDAESSARKGVIKVNVLVLLVLVQRHSACSGRDGVSSGSMLGSTTSAKRSDHQPAPLTAAAAQQQLVQQQQQHEEPKQQQMQQQAVTHEQSAAATASERCAPLSRELLQRHAQNGIIMLAVTDWRMFNAFGRMWLEGVQQAGINNYVIAATDKQTVEYLDAKSIGRCISELAPEHEAADMQQGYAWGSASYNAATWRKPEITLKLLQLGFSVLHTDLDVRWLADPMPWLARHAKHADLLLSSDQVTSTNAVGDDAPEASSAWTPVNTGVLFARASAGGVAGMQMWLKLKDPHWHDNTGFLRMLETFKKEPEARSPHDNRLRQFNETALGVLPVSIVLNGYTYSLAKLHAMKKVTPLCVHMTWVSQALEGKFARLRENKWYPDPPEYYVGPKLLTMDLYTPPTPANFNNWTDGEAMITVHLRALKRQLSQLYPAMALAVLLGRTLVLPQLTCFCWNNWYAADRCRMPGDYWSQLPWGCSLEQVFQPKPLSEPRPAIGNASFSFREAPFLSNPRLPGSVLSARTTVDVSEANYSDTCGQGRSGCIHESQTRRAAGGVDERRLLLPQAIKDRDVVALLQPYADAHVLHLSDPVSLWGGFVDAAHKAQFEAWLDSVTSVWCCRKPDEAKAAGLPESEKLRIRTHAQHSRPAAQTRQVTI